MQNRGAWGEGINLTNDELEGFSTVCLDRAV